MFVEGSPSLIRAEVELSIHTTGGGKREASAKIPVRRAIVQDLDEFSVYIAKVLMAVHIVEVCMENFRLLCIQLEAHLVKFLYQ